MTLVRELEWESCLLEKHPDPEIEGRVERIVGRTGGSAPYFTECPWGPEAMARLNRALFTRVFLDHDLADLAGLVVSRDGSCRYCFAVQRVLLAGLGMPDSRIEQLEQEFRSAELSAGDRAALEFARRISRSDPLPGEADKEPMRAAGFSEMAIKELASEVALMVLFNRSSTLPALRPQGYERLPDTWYSRLALRLYRPLRRVRQDAQLAPLSEERKRGPFAYVVNALDGLPAAPELRRVLDEMWASPILPKRTKAFVFAVIARALGDKRAEQEAIRLLLGEGVDEDEIAAVLAHLASPKLDAVESLVVPFARETVWYEPAPLQRQARRVRDGLTNPQFLEFILVAALANAVCRLGIVVDRD